MAGPEPLAPLAPLAPGAAFALGEVLRGTYRIVSSLEEGGMGTLYLAEHVRLRRRFVIKVLARRNATDPDAIGRFHREAELVSQLHHPDIVQVIDFDTSPAGDPYLVMEHLVGETLGARLDRELRLDLERTIAIAWQIASALATAHEERVVHRDLKPANVYLVTARGHDAFVKLLDFGISKQMGRGRSITRELEVVGTPNYMAPEQALARPVDPRTDQFALACMVFRMLTGATPFSGPNVADTLRNVVTAPAPAVCERVPGIPGEVDVVLAKALAKDPELRFEKIADFAWALSEASGVARRTIAFSTAPPPPPTRRPPSSDEPTIDRTPRRRSGFVDTPPKAKVAPDEVAYLLEAARVALEGGDANSAGTLVEESARRIEQGGDRERHASDIASLFEQLLGGGACSVEPVAKPQSSNLTPKLAFVLSRIQGPSKVRDLLDASHFPEHELLHSLYGLIRRGHLRVV